MTEFIFRIKRIFDKYFADEMTVYAAQASFFIILAAFPFVMLLLSVIQLLPNISQSDFLKLIVSLTPVEYRSLMVRIINDLYVNSPGTILSITAVTALWSASKGMLSMYRGLNRVHGGGEKRNYIVTRLICSGYTIVFILICVLSLGLLVFGTSLQGFLAARFPVVAAFTHYIISLRVLILATLVFSFTGLYTYVPDQKLRLGSQLPGALFTTACWLVFSFAFSIYFNNFGESKHSGFSYMYGGLTAVVLLMLWLYGCICILFFGAELNYFAERQKSQK